MPEPGANTKEVTTEKIIQTLNEEQLELLTEFRVRCDERAYAHVQIMEEGCSIMHTFGMVISLTYRNGCPWPNFLWALEQRMMMLVNEMVALGASDEYDQDIAPQREETRPIIRRSFGLRLPFHDPCRTQDRSPKTPTKSHEHTRTESSFAIWDNGYVHRGTPQPYFKRFVSLSYNSLGQLSGIMRPHVPRETKAVFVFTDDINALRRIGGCLRYYPNGDMASHLEVIVMADQGQDTGLLQQQGQRPP
ncbi:unnamed protein product [Penicillium viridicatum]